MKLVYTNENRFFVSNAKNIVASSGIEVIVKNEYAAGGVGDLSPFDAWMELWVCNDEDYDSACRVIETALSNDGDPEWTCSQCDEINDASFDVCWQCQNEKQ